MELWHAIILGIVEGISEFLPISSTGHLTIIEKLLGYNLQDSGLTAFTAVIQIGAIAAAVLYFRKDIWRVATAWLAGLANKKARKNFDYKFGWAIILGSLPIAIIGLLFHSEIETTLRSLWWVAGGLIGWSIVMWLADRAIARNKKPKAEQDITWRDTLAIGFGQVLALIPGVSRSGATISVGLFRGFDRVTVTKLSFFLGIPALCAAGLMQAAVAFGDISTGVGWVPTIIATIVAFGVAYLSIAWLLRFVAKNDFSVFIWYRVGLGALLVAFLLTGVIHAV